MTIGADEQFDEEEAFYEMAQYVVEEYGIDRIDLWPASRSCARAEHRLVAMWLARYKLKLSWNRIAWYFGRTRPTVIRNCQRVDRRMKNDKLLKIRILRLSDRIV